MRWIARAGAFAVALCLLGVGVPQAGAVDLQTIGTYVDPVFVTSDPRNPDRIFVVEQGGTIKQTTPAGTSTFVDLTPEVLSGGERGLLSMAFAPDYPTSGLLYVYYTRQTDGSIQIAELHVSGGVADPRSLRPVIDISHPGQSNHNGGQLQFGPDGYLYFATGDGGGSDDPNDNGQDLTARLGKLLRIDPRRSGDSPYTAPADNPFSGPGQAREIWSYGLRNPYRFSFDRLTGALTIGDVGQGAREEVDYVPGASAGRGLNFGWDCREGLLPLTFTTAPCTGPFTDPIHDYDHGGGACAITGGYVVRDPGLTELYGRYVYADYCVGQIRSLTPAVPRATGDRSEGISVANPSSFGEDSCGRVYVTSLTDDTVARLVDSTPTDCSAAPPPPPGDCTVRIDGDGKGNQLNGGPGSQAIDGGAGRDRIRGGDGNDCIAGGAGADVLSGNAGADVIRGGPGGDVLRARDGERDRLACGNGKDRAIVDGKDRVRGCERERKKAA